MSPEREAKQAQRNSAGANEPMELTTFFKQLMSLPKKGREESGVMCRIHV